MNAPSPPNPPEPRGALAENIVLFARALRDAGAPVGPGAILDAIAAVEATGFGAREDFRAALHATFVKRHEHTLLFDQAFNIFWKRKGLIEKMIAMMSPVAPGKPKPERPEAGANRVAEALVKSQPKTEAKGPPTIELDARFTMSAIEVLRAKDFAQMTADEVRQAEALIDRLAMPVDWVRTRRFVPSPRRARVDLRRSFRRSLSGGGAIDLSFRAPAERHPPIVALCDISGSMSEYSRLFLHFLHALGQNRAVTTFLFGTRLTNVTRALRSPGRRRGARALRGPGGRLVGGNAHRRVAAPVQPRLVAPRARPRRGGAHLFTDGLERDGVETLRAEMERLRKSCRRIIWVNPLLRYDAFEAKAHGFRAMLPFVDDFRPIHNLKSMADLCRALDGERGRWRDPKAWLARLGVTRSRNGRLATAPGGGPSLARMFERPNRGRAVSGDDHGDRPRRGGDHQSSTDAAAFTRAAASWRSPASSRPMSRAPGSIRTPPRSKH